MLEVHDLATFYGPSQALFGVSFDVGADECVTLIGRNGMGKTTTVNSTMGIVSRSSGEIRLAGERIDGEPSHKIARRGLALVPEGRQVFPNLTAEENLIATARGRGGRWDLDAIYALFPELKARRTSMGNLLSGGEQQMLAIGRALMTNPDLLILDEATEGLAPMVRTRIWEVLSNLRDAGIAILVIDKNIQDLTRIADRHLIIEKGRIAWSGTSADLLADPSLKERYLGV
ncbi:MAG: ABC transporter ATP-binding protein [Pseudomonadota bacterium]